MDADPFAFTSARHARFVDLIESGVAVVIEHCPPQDYPTEGPILQRHLRMNGWSDVLDRDRDHEDSRAARAQDHEEHDAEAAILLRWSSVR